jgi:signal peptidase I
MSQPFSDNGDAGAVRANGHPGLPAPRTEASAGAGVRPPHKPDWRLQSLSTQSGHHHVPRPPDGTDQPRRRRRHPFLASAAVFIVVVALAAWLLQAFVIQPFAVPGQMMAPAIQAGDRILVVKLGLFADPIRAGEIIVLRSPRSATCTAAGGGGADLVLRVVALPGQTIWSLGNTIFVDGRPLHEQGWYDRRFGQIGPTPVPATTLARNQYFVMGDNRSQACDSRAFGPISKSSIVGQGIAIVVRHGHVYFQSL